MKKSKVKKARLRQAIRHRKLTGATALRAAHDNSQTLDVLLDAEAVAMLNLSTAVAVALIAAEEDNDAES